MTERRRDPITGEWRTFVTPTSDPTPGSGFQARPIDERCPLCPTVDPAAPTEVPWPSFDVAVLERRAPLLTAKAPPPGVAGVGVYRVQPAMGADEVVVHADDHGATLASLGPVRVRLLVDVWAERYADLGAREDIAYVLVFEDRAEGAAQHPHSQVHGYPDVPPLPARELDAARQHLVRRGTCVQCDVVAQERSEGLRIVAENDTFLAFVPFAARFPYEVHVVVHRHVPSLLDLSDPDRDALAHILVEVARRYETWAGGRLPYVMALHQAPTADQAWEPISHLHLEFTPVGVGTGGDGARGAWLGADATLSAVAPEQAAAELRGAG